MSRTQKKKTPAIVPIHFADGNKGGVGKSFLARTLYQYFIDHKQAALGVEADLNSPDFKGIYPDAVLTQFSEDEVANAEANNILNLAIDHRHPIVVNLPATVHTAFKLWSDTYGVPRIAENNQLSIVKWFVCTGEFDSLKSLCNSLKTFGTVFPHVVVKNLRFSEWDYFEHNAEVHALIQDFQCQVISLPKLPIRVTSSILENRLSFADALQFKGERFGVAEQSAVFNYLKAAYQAFESTGLFPPL
jgi:hypothetical protein